VVEVVAGLLLVVHPSSPRLYSETATIARKKRSPSGHGKILPVCKLRLNYTEDRRWEV
jgi:hypothetical protein